MSALTSGLIVNLIKMCVQYIVNTFRRSPTLNTSQEPLTIGSNNDNDCQTADEEKKKKKSEKKKLQKKKKRDKKKAEKETQKDSTAISSAANHSQSDSYSDAEEDELSFNSAFVAQIAQRKSKPAYQQKSGTNTATTTTTTAQQHIPSQSDIQFNGETYPQMVNAFVIHAASGDGDGTESDADDKYVSDVEYKPSVRERRTSTRDSQRRELRAEWLDLQVIAGNFQYIFTELERGVYVQSLVVMNKCIHRMNRLEKNWESYSNGSKRSVGIKRSVFVSYFRRAYRERQRIGRRLVSASLINSLNLRQIDFHGHRVFDVKILLPKFLRQKYSEMTRSSHQKLELRIITGYGSQKYVCTSDALSAAMDTPSSPVPRVDSPSDEVQGKIKSFVELFLINNNLNYSMENPVISSPGDSGHSLAQTMADCLTDAECEKLVEELTKSGGTAQGLDNHRLKQLKTYCRRGGADRIDRVFRQLFHALAANHSQIRCSALLLIDELFRRSHHFRLRVVDNLSELFELCLGLKPKTRPLPKPKAFAERLRQSAIDSLRKWTQEFGEGYETLRSAVKYLTDNRLVDFAERAVQTTDERQAADEELRRRQNVMKTKIEKCVEELRELSQEVDSVVTQINSCFELLLPNMAAEGQDIEGSDDYSSRVKHLTDFSVDILLKPFAEIVDNDDTNPIISNLRELHSELSAILANRLKPVIQVMSKGYDLCEPDLKRAIDLKYRMSGIRQKFVELKIIKSGEELIPNHTKDLDDSDDDFEEVPEKEGLEMFIPEHLRHEYGLEPLDHNQPSTSGASSSSSGQSSSKPSSSETTSTALECKAMLPSGKLCPRRDAVKCPFHGPIVERDFNGEPLDAEHRRLDALRKANALPEWQNPRLLRELKASTGIDLTLNSTRKRAKKFPELQDIKRPAADSRRRLERRVFNKARRERVDKDLNEIQSRNQTHFEDQWNYSLQSLSPPGAEHLFRLLKGLETFFERIAHPGLFVDTTIGLNMFVKAFVAARAPSRAPVVALVRLQPMVVIGFLLVFIRSKAYR
ncbi:unnamed protein product [Medioppia subpectinata]|uniref:UV-stimulated scaffold protein A C-terminal domain-containing protein n=1 Tax=Medioppia subpectinata TaxID=1979941 RepID=A0A7R9Q1V9_9ACAR|nr:unnamed protein product [Medioppia subpectinata]CAG2109671.1 unnamed protein product [Medioppia subpectinata]